MRSVSVDVEALGAVLVRTVDEEPVHDPKTGERMWRGTVMVPTPRGAEEIGFKTSAAQPPSPGSRVKLTGEAQLTSWYQARGRSGTTGVTLRCSGWAEFTGQLESDHFLRGIPVALAPMMVLGWGKPNDRGDRTVEFMAPPDAKFDRDGGCVEVTMPVEPLLQPCDMGRLVEPQAAVNLVDIEDVGRYGKAQLRLIAAGVELVQPLVTAGRSGRSQPTPASEPGSAVAE